METTKSTVHKHHLEEYHKLVFFLPENQLYFEILQFEELNDLTQWFYMNYFQYLMISPYEHKKYESLQDNFRNIKPSEHLLYKC